MTIGAPDVFEQSRAALRGRAYRIVGTLADADDVVQEAWLRWSGIDPSTIERPQAWLNTVVTRLALDQLRKRKRDEQRYVGPWLPTPHIDSPVAASAADPADHVELADSLTMAFLLMLERLTPDERAAFLLADVFHERFDDVAVTMDRSPAACRQLASRARRKLHDVDLRRRDQATAASEVVRRFLTALASGDEPTALACVAPDAVYLSDAGPDHRAARRAVVGSSRVVRLLSTLARRYPVTWIARPAVVGGFPGIVIDTGDRMYSAVSFEVVEGQIVRILSMINPDKLTRLDLPII